ncbi:ABC transporter ATP-binding protein [Streptomyces sp. NPDC020597]|uniref:ABC transporter ATP-binding protein n=1 Tax=unclassified Streptomyces TaxID=2593676 RepID=UPI00378C7820
MNHMPHWYPNGQAADGEHAVRVTGLTVAAPDGRLLLDGADLAIRPGRVTAVTGPSGCGKTTLLRAVAGALPPGARHSAGTVAVLGRDPLTLPPADLRTLRRHHLAYVGQDPGTGLNPRMKVRRLLAEVAVDRTAEAIQALLAEVRLPVDGGLADRRVGALSGGQQRRVGLARALARRPAVLLLDEPTAGLDPALRDEIAELLRHLAENHRLAVALSCHDTDLVGRLADDVVDLSGRRTPQVRRPVPRAVVAGPAVLTGSGLHAAHGHRGRRTPVLHGVDLTVPAGGSVGVVGASGSGKTTLLRTLIGLHRPTTGTVALDGARLAPAAHGRSREQRRRLQFVPQDPLATLNPSRTIGATLCRPLLLHRRADRARAPERVLELLESVGLPAASADRYPHELSGGQRQRAAIARALASDPDVLFCDEITSALDADTAVAVMDLLAALREQRDLSLVLVSHDLRLVADRTDALVVMSEGHVVESGPTAQLFSSPAHPVTAALTTGVPLGG